MLQYSCLYSEYIILHRLFIIITFTLTPSVTFLHEGRLCLNHTNLWFQLMMKFADTTNYCLIVAKIKPSKNELNE